MTDELEKQAIKLWRKEWSTDMNSAMWSGTEVCRFAASFAAQVREQSKWVSVAERLPKEPRDGDPEFVIVCWKEEWRGKRLSEMSEDNSFAPINGIDTCFIPYFLANHYHQATHWQPLPAPPSTSQGQGE